LDKPETVIGEDAPVPVNPPGLDVTVYPVIIAGRPRSVGAVKVTEAEASPLVAVPIVGAPGTLGDFGHELNFCQKDCWSIVQIPEAPFWDGVTGVLVIKPPGYCLDIRYLNP
jgi:hypothetical protein